MDKRVDADCESVPKCASTVIKLASAKKFESELATVLCVPSVNAPLRVTWFSFTNKVSTLFISPSLRTKAIYRY